MRILSASAVSLFLAVVTASAGDDWKVREFDAPTDLCYQAADLANKLQIASQPE